MWAVVSYEVPLPVSGSRGSPPPCVISTTQHSCDTARHGTTRHLRPPSSFTATLCAAVVAAAVAADENDDAKQNTTSLSLDTSDNLQQLPLAADDTTTATTSKTTSSPSSSSTALRGHHDRPMRAGRYTAGNRQQKLGRGERRPRTKRTGSARYCYSSGPATALTALRKRY